MDRNGGSLPADCEKRWYAIHVRSRAEKRAASNLQAKGIESFAALERQRRVWCDRIANVDLPLFPGYIFARYAPFQRRIIEDARGVVSIVGFGGKDEPVADSEIEAIETIVASGLHVAQAARLVPGAKSRITYGPLKGAEGVLVRRATGCAFVVAVSLLQRAVEVELDEAYLQVAC